MESKHYFIIGPELLPQKVVSLGLKVEQSFGDRSFKINYLDTFVESNKFVQSNSRKTLNCGGITFVLASGCSKFIIYSIFDSVIVLGLIQTLVCGIPGLAYPSLDTIRLI